MRDFLFLGVTLRFDSAQRPLGRAFTSRFPHKAGELQSRSFGIQSLTKPSVKAFLIRDIGSVSKYDL